MLIKKSSSIVNQSDIKLLNDHLTSWWNRTVVLIIANSPIVSGRNVISGFVDFRRAPRLVLGDVAVVEGAGVVSLVPDGERKLARKVGHSDAGGTARDAS